MAFTVVSKGRGRPDYTPAVTASKPVLVANQSKWEVLVTRRACDGNPLAGRTVAAVAAYTVPAGYQLILGGAVITCDVSCMQKVVMVHTPGLIGDFRYDMRGDLLFTSLSSTIVDPLDTLTIYIYNLDTAERDFSVSMTGVLEAV